MPGRKMKTGYNNPVEGRHSEENTEVNMVIRLIEFFQTFPDSLLHFPDISRHFQTDYEKDTVFQIFSSVRTLFHYQLCFENLIL